MSLKGRWVERLLFIPAEVMSWNYSVRQRWDVTAAPRPPSHSSQCFQSKYKRWNASRLINSHLHMASCGFHRASQPWRPVPHTGGLIDRWTIPSIQQLYWNSVLMCLRCCVFITDIYMITHTCRQQDEFFSFFFLKIDHFCVIKNRFYFDWVVIDH